LRTFVDTKSAFLIEALAARQFGREGLGLERTRGDPDFDLWGREMNRFIVHQWCRREDNVEEFVGFGGNGCDGADFCPHVRDEAGFSFGNLGEVRGASADDRVLKRRIVDYVGGACPCEQGCAQGDCARSLRLNSRSAGAAGDRFVDSGLIDLSSACLLGACVGLPKLYRGGGAPAGYCDLRYAHIARLSQHKPTLQSISAGGRRAYAALIQGKP
jgi:hypothetical protein